MQATSDKTGSVGFTQTGNTTNLRGVIGDVTGNAYGKTGYSPFYQWGRKDAFRSKEYTTAPAANTSLVFSATSATVGGSIQNPTTYYNNNNTDYNPYVPVYYNAWNATYAGLPEYSTDNIPGLEKVVKTVYDPCPVGYTVTPGNTFMDFTKDNFTVSGNGRQYTFNEKTLYFPIAGERNGGTGVVNVNYARYWLAVAGSSSRSRYFSFDSTIMGGTLASGSRSFGFNIRPVREN